MSFDPTQFDGSTMRLGIADKLSDSYVLPAAPAADGTVAADTVDPAYRAKAVEAAVKFESFFIGQMLHQMRSGSKAIAAEEASSSDSINKDMLDMADNLVADQLAGKRAFGVADAILRQLLPPATAPVTLNTALPGRNAAGTGGSATGSGGAAEDNDSASARPGVAVTQNIGAALNPAE